MEDIITILLPFAFIGFGFGIGAYREKQHYESIRKRERQTLQLPVINFGCKQPLPDAKEARLFVGEVVISPDAFKTFVLALRNLVGGRVTVYESLLDRARRESLLRLKEQAIEWGATQVLNVRYETATIGNSSKKGVASLEVIVYGTAIR
ncbi:MAG: heavy metal-binding domain-containing protein [Cyanobacteria bacterium SBLK]|nr:heavy metal-binding domain-containing protein [Cyanobacteria bacterium SBLK]